MKQLAKIVTLLSILTVFKLVEVLANEMVVKGVGGNGTSIRNTGTDKDVEIADNHPA